jgi:hypothetical protein
LIGSNFIVADGIIGANGGAASRASVIVTFTVEVANAFPFDAKSAGWRA